MTLAPNTTSPISHIVTTSVEKNQPGRSAWKAIATPFRAVSRPLSITLSVLVWIAVIGGWFALTYSGAVKEMFLPRPESVLSTTISMALDGSLWEHVLASVQVVLIGFVISSIVAVPLGLTMGTYRIVQAALDPLVNFIRYLPVTSFVPLFILWIGIGIEQRVAVIIFGIFFQQLVMIADSARGVQRDLVNAAYTLGTKRGDTVFHIVFPATLPNVLDVLRVTMGWAWTYLVVAELVAARSGLGYISLKAMRGFQVDVIFMAIAMIGILGLCTDQLFRGIRRIFAPWAN
ncbi:binding-protein-dependent transport systems inner membrane component [Mesorhizobium opportunistum WSM2075]|uniref:Binding-protein-dependent transport systems inner membrane component n=1 Tax=Mesorhizobium opportunistum (strain LMG 24607 / HAMBI 3007 / WSM2075) TaxID=536019 RepID=F7YHM6_MESOW|nr:binding-protein-dependent transport systems inner membrane component [Mesorhizobium opportunistum WSM2075]